MAGILQEPWAKDGGLPVITRRTTSRDAFLDRDQEHTESCSLGKRCACGLVPRGVSISRHHCIVAYRPSHAQAKGTFTNPFALFAGGNV